jgi:hypothetical protein
VAFALRRAATARFGALTLGLAALAACSAGPSEPADTACLEVVRGTPQPGLAPLAAQELESIAAVLVDSGTGRGAGLCSGVVVGRAALLSAAHCFDADGDRAVDVGRGEPALVFGPRGFDSRENVRATRVAIHPTLDVAVVEWDASRTPALPVALSVNATPLDDSWIGEPVELAGFGASEQAGPGSLAFAVEPVVRVEATHVIVDGRGLSGACAGDSGGPVFGRADDGRFAVLGVLDDGAADCTGEDRYTRLDLLRDWEPFQRALASATPPQLDGCSELPPAGLCSRGRAIACEVGALRVDRCGAQGKTCGWDARAEKFRCLEHADDPCR